MTVSEYICDFLEKNGVSTVFLVTGGQAMYLNDALGRKKEIRSICVHHEQAAGMSADAYGRITNTIGVAMVTAGPGSINVVNGLVGGWTDSAPMMIISGQSAYNCVEYQAKSGIRQYGIQGIYIKPFVEKATKFFVTVDDPSKIRYYLEKAYYLATHGRPGPVWIDVPLDIQRMQVPEKLLEGYIPEKDTVKISQRKMNVEKCLAWIKSSTRPLIIAGQGVASAGARMLFRRVIERLNIPVITTRLGIDLLEYDHPLFVGHPGNYGDRPANFAVQNADLILAIGSRLATAAVGHNASQFGKHARKIVVDIDSKELDKPGVIIDLKIQDDAKNFLNELDNVLEESSIDDVLSDTSQWRKQCHSWKTNYPVVQESYKSAVPINSYHFIDRLSLLSGSEDVIMVDTGSCFHVACQAWKVKRGQHFLTTGGLSSMGYWCAGIGACAANKYQNTIVITGDGSLQMNIQEFATIRHNNLPIKTFILNNQGYLLIRQTQKNFMEGRLFGESAETGVWCPDSLKIAEAYGIKGVRIDSLENMDAKIHEVLDYNGPVVCDVVTDPWQLLIPRVSSDKKADGSLVSRKFEDMYPYIPAEELQKNMVSER